MAPIICHGGDEDLWPNWPYIDNTQDDNTDTSHQHFPDSKAEYEFSPVEQDLTPGDQM